MSRQKLKPIVIQIKMRTKVLDIICSEYFLNSIKNMLVHNYCDILA